MKLLRAVTRNRFTSIDIICMFYGGELVANGDYLYMLVVIILGAIVNTALEIYVDMKAKE